MFEEKAMESSKSFKNLLSLAAFVFCLVLLPSLAGAEIKEGSTTLSFFAGGFIFDHDLNLKDKYTVGLGIGYNITKHWGVELAGFYVPTESERAAGLDDKDNDVYYYHGDLLYHFMPDGKLVPFFAIGAGGMTFRPKEKGVDSDNEFAADYGIGLKYFLTPTVALRGDVRHVIACDECDTFNNLLYTLGLSLSFGGRDKAAPIAAAPVPEPVPAPAPAPEPVVVPPHPVPAPAPEVEEKSTFVFRNIYFDTNKSNIKPRSGAILDEVAVYLKANPAVRMEIQGHTDSRGTAQYNMKLSEARASSVKTYLVKKHGIDESRLTTKGYGLTRPAAPNGTVEGWAKNRRVEFAPLIQP
jgi:OOP family OmpA-OmpF porin